MSDAIKSNIGGIWCYSRYGEALAWSALFLRAEKYPHEDNISRRNRARASMLASGWTDAELEEIQAVALKHGTYGVEQMAI